MIRKLGSNLDKLCTYQNLQSKLKKFGEYVLLYGLVIIQLKLGESVDVQDSDGSSKETSNDSEVELFMEFDE